MKKIIKLVIVLILFVTAFFPKTLIADDEERTITITLHSGESGYFGEPEVKEKESVQFIGDVFTDDTIPDTDESDLLFLGWSMTENSDKVDVESGVTPVSQIEGTDLYAVWSSIGCVHYNIPDGSIIVGDEEIEVSYTEAYNIGENFIDYQAVHKKSDIYEFDGWYEGINGKGKRYDSETVIDLNDIDVFANWKFNEDNIDSIEEEVSYYEETEGTTHLYKFIPEKDANYTLFTFNTADDGLETFIELRDIDTNVLKRSEAIDPTNPQGDVTLSYDLEAGKPYIFSMREMGGGNTNFMFMLVESEVVSVTFYANHPNAYFDGDTEQTSKVIELARGMEIHTFDAGLEVADPNTLRFGGWALSPDADWLEGYIFAEDGMEVYGVFEDLDSLVLDANGGYFPMLNNAPDMVYSFAAGEPFNPPMDPKIDDTSIKFAGWSIDKNATEPDADIIEGVTLSADLPKTLYAVYTEKVVEIFDANGGYMMDDPEITTYETTKGKGHIFYGMTMYHLNPRMKALALVDHKGVEIPYTAEIWPYYHVMEDTTYKTLWGYRFNLDANGGEFGDAGTDRLSAYMRYDGTWDYESLDLNTPIHYNPQMYFVGWATEPNATEPNVIEGKTKIKDIENSTTIYAVWKEDTYEVTKGAKSSWTKGSNSSLDFTVKRKGNDDDTFMMFSNITVDGVLVKEENYIKSKGSLKLALKPTFLETLKLGEHEIVFRFIDKEVKTTFTVKEKAADKPKSSDSYTPPKTGI